MGRLARCRKGRGLNTRWGRILLGWYLVGALEVPRGYNGIRLGEAANPGPYEQGGATASGQAAAGDGTEWGDGGSEEEWWDRHEVSVQESWAMLNAIEGFEGKTWPEPEERARLWEEYDAQRQEVRRPGESRGTLAEGDRDEHDVDAFEELEAWLDDRERASISKGFGDDGLAGFDDRWEEMCGHGYAHVEDWAGGGELADGRENLAGKVGEGWKVGGRLGFIAAGKFGGNIEGMVFKRGDQGMGYYPDGPIVDARERKLIDGRAPLCLDRLIGKGEGPEGNGRKEELATGVKRRRKNRRRRQKGAEKGALEVMREPERTTQEEKEEMGFNGDEEGCSTSDEVRNC